MSVGSQLLPKEKPKRVPINDSKHVSVIIDYDVVVTRIIVNNRKRTMITNGYSRGELLNSEKEIEIEASILSLSSPQGTLRLFL